MALVSQWKLDGNALDSAGTYNLTAANVEYPAYNRISGNYCLKTNGTGSTIDGTFANILAYSSFTITGWHRIYSGTGGDIISFGNGAGGASWQIFVSVYNSVYYLYPGKYLSLDTAQKTNLQDYYYKWVFISVVDTNGSIAVYINGVLRSSLTNSRSGTATNLVSVGSNTAGGTDYYGYNYLDDVRFYSHALTEAEVRSLYNSYFTEKATSFMAGL